MQLAGAAIVRNEADIIEAFVRHNLTLLDRLVVVDHGSFDGTPAILAALAAEGLPLTVLRDDRVGFFQPELLTSVSRQLLTAGADFVFMLDADEFIRAKSRDWLHHVLRRVPPGRHLLLPWVTYIPDFTAPQTNDLRQLLLRARCPQEERHGLDKVVVARHFLDNPEAFVAMGNHRVYASDRDPGAPSPHARVPREALALAHVPIRSAEQLTAKVAIGWLAHLAAHRDNPQLSFHWREAYQSLAAGHRFTADELAAMAANYSLPRAQWQPLTSITLVDEPFLADFTLRHRSEAQVDPFARVLVFAERLAGGPAAS